MKRNSNQAITLIELLICISLLAMVVAGLFGIDVFSHRQLISSDKRTKLQNEASYVLEHITKHFINAIGDSSHRPVDITPSGQNTKELHGTIDGGDGILGSNDDYDIYYCYAGACTGFSAPTHSLYFKNGANAAEPLVQQHVSKFLVTYNPTQNYMDVSVSTCWDSSNPNSPCGAPDNPTITLNATVHFPSVSTH